MAVQLSTLASDTPCPIADLHDDALRRARAARHLAHLMTTASFRGLTPTDFERTLEVFDFLLQDVCVILESIELQAASR